MYAAWEVGVWKALREHFQFDLIVGTSAGAWNGWMIASGVSPDELIREWLDPAAATIMQFGLHRYGILRPQALHEKARDLFARFQPRIPCGLTLAEVPRLRPLLVRNPEVTWRHLAAACSIPLCFPPVEIEGKLYVDGGLLGALPTWAAEEMRATHAITVNALTTFPFRMMRTLIRPRRPSAALKAFPIEPSQKLGPLWDGLVWSPANIKRWIEQGERDGNRAATSIAM
jgi:predicted acylesterase/phospholipase RssA